MEVFSKKNHGIVKSAAGKYSCHESYGKDDSNKTGSAKAERGKQLGGSVTNLAHSITNSSAKQE